MKSLDGKRILAKKVFKNRNEETFTDLLDAANDLSLSNCIDRIDMVDAFLPVTVSLMNRIDSYVSWSSLWIRRTPFAILAEGRLGLLDGEGAVEVKGALS